MDMIRLAWSRFRHGAHRSIATFLALDVAVTSFVVLAASTETQQLQVTETANKNFRAAYDILVRPKGSTLGLEKSEGLVRSNYLSGTFGGLTLDQVSAVRAVPGVQVAAPIAMVGYYYQSIPVTVDATQLLPRTGRTLLRWQSSITARNRTAKTIGPGGYLYRTDNELISPQGEIVIDPGTTVEPGPTETVDGQALHPCPGLTGLGDPKPGSPFDQTVLWEAGQCQSSQDDPADQEYQSKVTVRLAYPMLIAAIDPQAEAQLVGLDAAVYDGRYLDAADSLESKKVDGGKEEGVPVLLAGTQKVDYQLRLTIDSLPDSTLDQLGLKVDPERNQSLIQGSAGATLYDKTYDAAAVYRSQIASRSVDEPWYSSSHSSDSTVLRTAQFWRPTDVSYQAGSPLRPVEANVSGDVWRSWSISSNSGFEVVPMTTQDTSYRTITSYTMGRQDHRGSEGTMLNFDLVGKFDPANIDEFSELSAVPLETYTSPELTGADEASRHALDDRAMDSDLNIGGYLQQTPTMLMSLNSLKGFSSDRVLTLDGSGKTGTFDDTAPISAIRVRVSGVIGIDQASRDKIAEVATAVQAATGADVDITIGSSPESLQVALPATTLGSPALALDEPWTRKGVAYRTVAAIDLKSFLLFSLILISSALTVAISTGAAVQSRRRELGILASFGWTSARRSVLVLTELAILGIGAGVVGVLASWPLALAVDARFDWPRALLAIPAALLLSLLAGTASARAAGRLRPIDAIRPAELAGGRRMFHVRGGISLGLQRVLRRPGRLLLGAVAVSLAVAALIVLLVLVRSFRSQVIGTLLGNAVAIQVRAQDLVAGTFLAILGLTAVAMVLHLNIGQDARMYATLQAVGWRRATLTTAVTTQALAIGLVGAGIGATAGLAITMWLVGTIPAEVATLTWTIAAGATLAALLAAISPTLALRRISTAGLLAAE